MNKAQALRFYDYSRNIDGMVDRRRLVTRWEVISCLYEAAYPAGGILADPENNTGLLYSVSLHLFIMLAIHKQWPPSERTLRDKQKYGPTWKNTAALPRQDLSSVYSNLNLCMIKSARLPRMQIARCAATKHYSSTQRESTVARQMKKWQNRESKKRVRTK